MKLKSFLKLVEIQTKLASVIPFLLGTVYAIYRFHEFNIINFILMFISLIHVDMMTTAINNYIDYKKAKKNHGYNYELHNAIVRDNLKESTVLVTIFILFIIAVVSGLILYLRTDIIVLLLGAISFLVGICYSFGPVPISRIPLGEVFSGFFMGFVITFIADYIHVFDKGLIRIAYNNSILSLFVNLKEIVYIFLLSLPAVIGIANIMLANNICDIEDDIENKRYTLPIYIGKEKSLMLYKILYYFLYLNILLTILIGINSFVVVLTLITFIVVSRNIKIFYDKQTKKDTFSTAVQNFALVNIIYILSICIGILFPLG
ncbi:MAG TPA: 1,4-dihydroxy-2-naphthoate polyprenyltransferase [Defluviitaleaceae bacterium]|mgnify:FL=1|nr:1,4-dihydroxy-2-naphthoate polyprenyltransferase [Candidatus Epulonipiscium sp.]HOQ17383.1 1,4-dihydroxy-2-naphthoate polyprenyltransferase [Defluviitaleaceae bacterium]HPT75935.1 1,4-dihydroxy-2-naphthoate polyprenyltransferase [Defluviitaleaceae bacterium]HQD51310.1 1,4-dihydroxy-2-naphthoate polyprenyltransferase [Defluviitaleaceae bacterium]